MRKTGLHLLTFFVSGSLFAKPLPEIKGSVLDERKEPVPFASAALLFQHDSTIYLTAITDTSGNYLFPAV